MAKRINRIVESWTYVPVGDRDLPPDQQTTFRLRPMAQPDRVVAHDDVTRTLIAEDGTKLIIGRERHVARDVCLRYIAAVENFPVGAPTPWPSGREARVAYLEQFDDEVVREIGNEVFMRSTLGELEKNS